jgi:streptomycin 6-kinase
MCEEWADSLELACASDRRGLGPGLAREAVETLRALPGSATTEVLLCTDMHAGNVLATRREPWLMIDPKPFISDPAFDPIQHMLNCDDRLVADPPASRTGWRAARRRPRAGPPVAIRPLRTRIAARPDHARTGTRTPRP